MIAPSRATLALPPGAARERHSIEVRLDVELALSDEARERGDRDGAREHVLAALALSNLLRRFDSAQRRIEMAMHDEVRVSAPGGMT